MLKKILITIVAILTVASATAYFNRAKLRNFIFESQKKNLPESVSYKDAQKKIGFVDGQIETIDIIPVEADLEINKQQETGDRQQETGGGAQPAIPESYNLGVPFTSQAPFVVWDEVHKEACEESSAIMAAKFVLGLPIGSAEDADKEILALVEWERKNFGFWKDTDADKTAQMIRVVYKISAEVKFGITLDDIKREIAAGNPVIVPAAGRELKNPYYTPPGPFYHMLVVRGYTKDKIITNDPGTKHGENFTYENDIFYNAIHDWKGGDVLNGQKTMIVVKR